MKKELLVQLFLIVGALMVVLFTWFFLQTDEPVLVQDTALADWLELEDYGAADFEGDGELEPITRMTPVPGSETEY